jgi:transcriptional regulator with XRE-family HTH domain
MPYFDDSTEIKVAVGQAVKACLKGAGLTQAALADALGMQQPTISYNISGRNMPSLQFLAAVEEVCGRPRGWCLIHAGLVDQPLTTESIILVDPRLTDEQRTVMLSAYRGFTAGVEEVAPPPAPKLRERADGPRARTKR